MRLSFALPVAALASQGWAAAAKTGPIGARQVSSDLFSILPSECQSNCAEVSTLFTDCSGLEDGSAAACMCTPATLSAIDRCWSCLRGAVAAPAAPGDVSHAEVEKQFSATFTQVIAGCEESDAVLNGTLASTPSGAGNATRTSLNPGETGSSGDSGAAVGAPACPLGLGALLASAVGAALAL